MNSVPDLAFSDRACRLVDNSLCEENERTRYAMAVCVYGKLEDWLVSSYLVIEQSFSWLVNVCMVRWLVYMAMDRLNFFMWGGEVGRRLNSLVDG